MIEPKSLKDISWLVTEEEYRNDKALSYSTLARFNREGFNSLDKLFDKIESPSLVFGSAVDSIITGGEEEFNSRFIVASFPSIPDSIIKIVKRLFNTYKDRYTRIKNIPKDDVIYITQEEKYQLNWKPETRVSIIIEKGDPYYNLLYISEGKTIIDTETYKEICKAVDILKESQATEYYFKNDNPFEPEIERLYQLKFKDCLEGIEYRCMFDELIVNHKDKTIQPIDLKTSCKKNDREWNFPTHYIEWDYQIQNRLYVRILESVISKNNYFKDFKILPYKDIIIFKGSDTPLVWDIPFTFDKGTLYFGKNRQIQMKDPFDLGKELHYYLTLKPTTPININSIESNNITEWLNKI